MKLDLCVLLDRSDLKTSILSWNKFECKIRHNNSMNAKKKFPHFYMYITHTILDNTITYICKTRIYIHVIILLCFIIRIWQNTWFHKTYIFSSNTFFSHLFNYLQEKRSRLSKWLDQKMRKKPNIGLKMKVFFSESKLMSNIEYNSSTK